MAKKKSRYANIEAERVRNGLSKIELSNVLEISPRTYANWQYNNGDIPASKLVVLSKFFGCTIDYLLA